MECDGRKYEQKGMKGGTHWEEVGTQSRKKINMVRGSMNKKG